MGKKALSPRVPLGGRGRFKKRRPGGAPFGLAGPLMNRLAGTAYISDPDDRPAIQKWTAGWPLWLWLWLCLWLLSAVAVVAVVAATTKSRPCRKKKLRMDSLRVFKPIGKIAAFQTRFPNVSSAEP